MYVRFSRSRPLLSKGAEGSSGRVFSAWLRSSSNYVTLHATGVPGSDVVIHGTTALRARAWNHFVFSLDSSAKSNVLATVYINGVVDISTTFAHAVVKGSNGPLYIGKGAGNAGPR